MQENSGEANLPNDQEDGKRNDVFEALINQKNNSTLSLEKP